TLQTCTFEGWSYRSRRSGSLGPGHGTQSVLRLPRSAKPNRRCARREPYLRAAARTSELLRGRYSSSERLLVVSVGVGVKGVAPLLPSIDRASERLGSFPEIAIAVLVGAAIFLCERDVQAP